MIRCVIFDLDGVVVHTDELHYRSWRLIADEEGISFDRAVNERLRGVDRAASLGIVLERATRAYTNEERAALMERKNALYRESLQRLNPDDAAAGCRELLAALRACGIRAAVASSSRNAPLILDRLGLSAAFDALADGNDGVASKPAPDLFLLAARRCGVTPGECLVIEDAQAGIEAASRAGMRVIGLDSSAGLRGASYTVPSLSNLTVEGVLRLG